MSAVTDFAKGFKKGMKEFGSSVSIIVNSILLGIVYLVGVAGTSIVAKIAGKHFMSIRTNKKAKSYWEDFHLKKKPLDDYYRQF